MPIQARKRKEPNDVAVVVDGYEYSGCPIQWPDRQGVVPEGGKGMTIQAEKRMGTNIGIVADGVPIQAEKNIETNVHCDWSLVFVL